MLKLRQEQFETFQEEIKQRFVDELSQHLCRRNVSVLPRFPEAQRRVIVGHMLDRGRNWGASLKDSLWLFADLLQTVAPNFDHDPVIREALKRGADTADNRILSLSDRVPRAIWRRAEAARVEIFLYTAPCMDALPLVERTAAAIPVVFWEQVAPEDARRKAEAAMSLAEPFGFTELQDGPLVLGLANALYGPELSDKTRYAWISDILNPGSPANVR